MATTRYIIGKGERPKISIRLRLSDSVKVQTVIKGLRAYKQFWSASKQRHNTKFASGDVLRDIISIDEKLSLIATHITSQVALMPHNAIDRQWLEREINAILGVDERKEDKGVIALIDDYICTLSKRILPNGRQMGKGSISQYKQLRASLSAFISSTNRNVVEVKDMDKAFYDDYVLYMYSRGLKPNTVGKHIKVLKAVLNSLPVDQKMSCGLINDRDCVTIAVDVDNVYLSEDELKLIAEAEMPSASLKRVRDMFILLAWTGCRFSDIGKLTRNNVVTLPSGHQYYKIVQRKTDAPVTIPILPAAREILLQYDYDIPTKISNQKFNMAIKRVCEIAGIKDDVVLNRREYVDGKVVTQSRNMKKWECVTAHTARRSFATNMYKRNFPTLMIMAITGHKTEKSFLKYIKVGQDENAERMMRMFLDEER